jgi:hypothetical protein
MTRESQALGRLKVLSDPMRGIICSNNANINLPIIFLLEISCDFIWILSLNRSLFSLYYSLNSFLS